MICHLLLIATNGVLHLSPQLHDHALLMCRHHPQTLGCFTILNDFNKLLASSAVHPQLFVEQFGLSISIGILITAYYHFHLIQRILESHQNKRLRSRLHLHWWGKLPPSASNGFPKCNSVSLHVWVFVGLYQKSWYKILLCYHAYRF